VEELVQRRFGQLPANSAGQPVTSGRPTSTGAAFSVDGRRSPTEETLTHHMHGFSIKSHTQGVFDWEVAASLYDYAKDIKRQNGRHPAGRPQRRWAPSLTAALPAGNPGAAARAPRA
jgi:hypothetical protein